MKNKLLLKIKLHRILIAVLGMVLLALTLYYIRLPMEEYSQEAAQRWSGGEGSWTQFSVFLSTDESKKSREIQEHLTQMKATMKQDLSISKDYDLGTFAWSATGKVNISAENKSAQVRCVQISENYFFFHPYHLLRGSYLDPEQREKMAVVDRNAASRLLGSIDVIGSKIQINGSWYVVAGVIESTNDEDMENTSEVAGSIFIPAATVEELSQFSVSTIDCVLTEQLTGYSRTILENTFGKNSSNIIENSSRFSIKNIFNRLISIEDMVKQERPFLYTKEENSARVIEYKMSRALGHLILILSIFLIDFFIMFNRIRKKNSADDKNNKLVLRNGVVNIWHQLHWKK